MNPRTKTSRSRVRSLGLFVVLALCIAAAALFYISWAGLQAEKTYAAYAAVQERYLAAAYKPGHESNPVRRQVGELLAEVLQVPMSDAERIEKAKQGIAHLNDLESQIDAIKDEGDTLAPLLSDLDQAASSIANLPHKRELDELVSLARRQVQIISDIRGLSYRADYYTDEVFERIIDDQGAMTDEHKRHLNELIPQLEEQFDQRSNLYTELSDSEARMNAITKELGYGE